MVGHMELVNALESVLADWDSEPRERSLTRAYTIGRRALEGGMGVLGIAGVLHEALVRAVERAASPSEAAHVARRLHQLYLEALSPFEMTHRGVQDANLALRRMNESLEEQARRIAHALHDESGQLMAAIHIALAEVARELPEENRHSLLRIKHYLEEAERQLRRLSRELRPTILDDFGLPEALRFLAEGVAGRSGILVHVETDLGPRLPPTIELGLYRIVQEALNNVVRHSGAGQARVSLQLVDGTVRCSVRDDGRGFEIPDVLERGEGRGMGILGIQERLAALGGTLRITSAPGSGTEIDVSVPLATQSAV